MRVVLVTSGCLVIAVVILGATPAMADDQPVAPALGLMDTTADGTELVLELATLIPTENVDGVVEHPRMQLQHIAASGFGGYAGFSAGEVFGGGDSGGSISNLDLGGLYQHRINPDLAIGVRAGLLLDTASDTDLANLIATPLTRPGDLATAVPGTWLRLGGSLRFRTGAAFMGFDAGVDVPVRSGQLPVIAHANLGAGITGDRWSGAVELGTLHVSSGSADSFIADSFFAESFTVIGLAAHYHGESASPYVMISTPLDDGLAGKIVTLTVGE
jgi:hypothetical protein